MNGTAALTLLLRRHKREGSIWPGSWMTAATYCSPQAATPLIHSVERPQGALLDIITRYRSAAGQRSQEENGTAGLWQSTYASQEPCELASGHLSCCLRHVSGDQRGYTVGGHLHRPCPQMRIAGRGLGAGVPEQLAH